MKYEIAKTFAVLRPGLTVAPVDVTPGIYEQLDRGTWHTARTSVSTTMLFVTPGEGTENRPVR